MILAHKIEMSPTKEQEIGLLKACGCARFSYNWGLAKWKELYQQGTKPNGFMLKKLFNETKKVQFPWMYESPKDANQTPFSNLQNSFNSFFQKKSGYPKFKKKGVHDSFGVNNDKAKIQDNYIYIPKIGSLRLTEQLRFDGKTLSYTISRIADKWFVSISVNIEDYYKDRSADDIIGVDMGIKSLVTLSTGEKVNHLSPLKSNLNKLQRLSRQHSRKKKGSNNRKKSAMKMARIHYKISCKRKDVIHKLTTQLCHENQVIVIEDLNVKGMIKNKHLSRSISDSSFAEIRRQLEYKSKIYNNTLIIADRFFPSSKTCSYCGSVKDKLLLSERIYKCEKCGLEIDRDYNATLNLCRLGYSQTYDCGQEGSGTADISGTKPCLEEAVTLCVHK